MFRSFLGKGKKKPDGAPVAEPLPDGSGAFLLTVPLPMIVEEEEADPGPVVDLLKMSPEQRLQAAMEIVEQHHDRIAKTIRALWGHKECSGYISKLILSGVDGTRKARVGFNQEAVDAMLVLGELHDAQFGAPPYQPGAGFDPDSGFSDSTYRTSWDTLR